MEKKNKGLGDTIAKITKATGIDKLAKKVLGDDCGCEERRKKLNQMFPNFRNIRQFTEDEMKKIKEFQESYVTIQQNLGQLSIAKLRLNQQLESLDKSKEDLQNKFTKTQKDEQKFIEEITKKYGDGTLNPETGTFIPNK